jgi:iron(III) transport system ATP-binding protein
MNLIEFVGVSKSYNGKPAVADFSLEIAEGERIVLLGPSGCGKTTVLRMLAGFIPPDKGKITIEGRLVAADGVNLIGPEKRGLGMVFQDLALWPHMTVKENLEFGLKAKGLPGSQRERRIRAIVGLVQMTDYLDAKPSSLSGGQQQRVALARALVLEPRSLLMDEPLSSLDHDLNLHLRTEILDLHDKLRFALIYITHDREEAFEIGTRIVIMKDGMKVLSGPMSEIKNSLMSPPRPGRRKTVRH